MIAQLMEIGRILLFIGVLSIFLGALITFSGNLPLIGKLPGDLYIRKWGLRVHIPLASSIVISLILNWILKHIK